MSTPLSEQTRWLGKRDGRPGTDVTCLGFGAATISNHHDAYQMSEAQAIDAVHSAYETGVRFYDTAPWYGWTRSERRLGLALNNYDRSAFRLQTKVGRYLVPGQPDDRDSTGGTIVNPAGGYPDGGHTTPGSRFGVTHDYSCEYSRCLSPCLLTGGPGSLAEAKGARCAAVRRRRHHRAARAQPAPARRVLRG